MPSDGDRRTGRKRSAHGRGPGRRKGSLNKATVEKRILAEIATAREQGRMLAVDRLDQIMNWAAQEFMRSRPYDESGNSRGKHADEERCLRMAQLTKECAIALAQYQSPKLSAVALATAPQPDCEPVRVRCTIFDEHGERVRSMIDAPWSGG
jgi:hypothetical protein